MKRIIIGVIGAAIIIGLGAGWVAAFLQPPQD